MDKILRASSNSKIKKQLRILNYLQKNGAKSRVELSNKLKLTKATVTQITNDMIKAKVLLEKGEQIEQINQISSTTHPRGRRKILLDINSNYKLVFGVVVEKENIIVGLTNLNGQVLDKKKKNYKDKTYRELLELIVLSINTIMKNNCINNDNLLALGLCLSNDVDDLIDGDKLIDKISRLKKDLSYAISMKISANNTMGGALIAQKLFGDKTQKSFLLIRYGDIVENGVMIDEKIYRGNTGNAGGLKKLMDKCECDELTTNNDKIASAIITCNDVLDTEKIYCFGTHFESEIEFLNIEDIILKKGIKNIELDYSVVNCNNLFLAPCAQAINSYFYFNSNTTN